MPQQNIFFHHYSHPHAPPKSDRVADALTRVVLISTTYFLCVERQHHPMTKQLLLKKPS
jgi:hypothetical protein